MTPLQPLIILLGQAEIERDAAQAELLRVLCAQQAASTQADQLLSYRRDYEQRWSAQFQSAGAMELVHCYRGFMDRLTMAVQQQQRVAQHAADRVDQARAALLASELRVATVRKLIERRTLEDRAIQNRREQKASDEFAARSAWNRRAGSDAAQLA
jgi:flagellar protein FliJ